MHQIRRSSRLVMLLILAGALVACSAEANRTTPGNSMAGASPAGRAVAEGIEAGDTGINDGAAVELVRAHLAASDDGDPDAWASALSADVRFDIGGSVYEGIDEVRGWGERDPIGRGRYELVSIEAVDGGVTTDVVFRAGSLVEDIRYQYTIRNGRIVNLLARYR